MKKITYDKLERVRENKTVVFWSPLDNDQDVFVRTGIIDEDSFYHSVLYGYSREYSQLNTKKRNKFVSKIKASMVSKITKEKWGNLDNELINKKYFKENLKNILENFYLFLEDKKCQENYIKNIVRNILVDEESIELYNLICNIVPYDIFIKEILPTIYEDTEKYSISSMIQYIIEYSKTILKNIDSINQLDSNSYQYVLNGLKTFLKEILEETENISFNEYKEGMETISSDINSFTIDSISNRFNRDIYILDSVSRLPINTSKYSLKDRKSIILLKIDNSYEIVGKLLKGNRILRTFSHDDPLIIKIKNFLINPEQIRKEYPNLSVYLENDKNSESESDTESESDSDSDSESESESDSDDNRSKKSSNIHYSDSDNDEYK